MKKHILHTLGLAAMAALLCVFCGDNSTNGTPGGEVNELLSKYNKRGSGITYTVTFDANGGSGAGPDAQSVNAASGLTLPDRGALTKDGFAFGGWNTEADGTGTLYSAGSSYSPTAHSTLYAVWNHIYTITFHANGGSGTVPSAATVSAGNSIQLPDGGGLSNGDLVFSGWNTEADGSGATRSAGSSYSPDGNITLYATWRVASTGDGDESSLVLAEGEAWVYNDSGYIFTADNRLIKIFKSDDIWWYAGTEHNYQTSNPILTIDNGTPSRYTISSGNTLLIDGYKYTFTRASVNPQTPYYLRISISSRGGSVVKVPEKNVYSYGEQVTVTVTESDSTFTGWSGASISTNATIIITMDDDKNLTVNFAWKPYFTDTRDNNTYRRVTINKQAWMAENLNYDVPENTTDVCYAKADSNCVKYGRLYNWTTAMGGKASSSANPSRVQGVCPVGWHLPSDAEWTTLTNFVGGVGGTKLKSSTDWTSSSNVPVGTNEYGWSALPGGRGYSDGLFLDAGYDGRWWSATESGTGSAWGRYMFYNIENVGRNDFSKTFLCSVRCVQDE
jgi:uncharacterized protein (TIGR02145 family)